MMDIMLAIVPTLFVITQLIITNIELRVTKKQNKLLWGRNQLLEKEIGLLFKLLSPILEEDE